MIAYFNFSVCYVQVWTEIYKKKYCKKWLVGDCIFVVQSVVFLEHTLYNKMIKIIVIRTDQSGYLLVTKMSYSFKVSS